MTPKKYGCLSMSILGGHCETINAVCGHVHVSDNRETLFDAEDSILPVDVDNKETLCDVEISLRACSRER